MTTQDLSAFSAQLVTLAELFDAPLSESKLWLYFEALRDLSLEQVRTAILSAAKTATFMPKPAELRRLAVGDTEDAAERAWMIFRRALQSAGAYASLVVADPALAETITAVFESWPAACAVELSPEMWAAKRKEFGRVYRVCVQRGLVGARYLPGICEQQNSGRRDWLTYVPVKRLEGHTVEALSFDDAEAARTAVAATQHGLTRLDASALDVQPDERGDTA